MNILNSSLQYRRPVSRGEKKDENEEKEQKNI